MFCVSAYIVRKTYIAKWYRTFIKTFTRFLDIQLFARKSFWKYIPELMNSSSAKKSNFFILIREADLISQTKLGIPVIVNWQKFPKRWTKPETRVKSFLRRALRNCI